VQGVNSKHAVVVVDRRLQFPNVKPTTFAVAVEVRVLRQLQQAQEQPRSEEQRVGKAMEKIKQGAEEYRYRKNIEKRFRVGTG
jgi:hypothetical protein